MTELFSDEMKDYFKQKSKEIEQDIEKNSIRIDVIADSKDEAKKKITMEIYGIISAPFRPHF